MGGLALGQLAACEGTFLQYYTRIISTNFSSCVMAGPTLLGDEVEGKGGDGVYFYLSNPASDTQ